MLAIVSAGGGWEVLLLFVAPTTITINLSIFFSFFLSFFFFFFAFIISTPVANEAQLVLLNVISNAAALFGADEIRESVGLITYCLLLTNSMFKYSSILEWIKLLGW